MDKITIGTTTMTMEEFIAKVNANRDSDGYFSYSKKPGEEIVEEIDPDLPRAVRLYLLLEKWYKNSNVKPEDRVSVKDCF